MRGKLFVRGFQSRISYRKVPRSNEGGFLFTYAVRFVDGRGETIEERLRHRFADMQQVQQYDLFGVVSRRLRQFRNEQEQLLKQEKEKERRSEIRAMKRVRGDTIDPLGALALIPEA